MAVREGFEPSVRCRTPAFQASSFDHSDTSPCLVYRHAIAHQWNLFFASIHPWVSPRSYFLYDRRQTAKLCFGFALPTQTPHRVLFTDMLLHISGICFSQASIHGSYPGRTSCTTAGKLRSCASVLPCPLRHLTVSCLPTCYCTSVEFVSRKQPSMGLTQVVLPVRPPANCEAVLRFCLAHSDTSPCLVYRNAIAHQ